MINSIFYIEIFLGVLLFGLAIRAGYSWSKYQEIEMAKEKYAAEIEYDRALNDCVLHPENKDLYSKCLEKGDLFLRFNIPDYFNYPLPEQESHVEFMDNRQVREEIVKKDLEARKDEMKKAHINKSTTEGQHKLAA
jgi:hypothetical protein